jgi:hypothetical protein
MSTSDGAVIGSTQIFTHLVDEPTPIGICPVFQYGNLVGHLISFGAPDGETLPDAEVGAQAPWLLVRATLAKSFSDTRMVAGRPDGAR